MDGKQPSVTVIMPTYKQEAFIRRAIDSLCSQTFSDWELLIVDDASPDATYTAVQPYLGDRRIRYYQLEKNGGMGAALNFGLDRARAPRVAYLPSDDVYYKDHLAALVQKLDENPQSAAAVSGIRHSYNRTASGQIENGQLQLVQVMHRTGTERWMERGELVTDDLDRMFWSRLREKGSFEHTGQVSCEWVDHPHQRHKILREPVGGINPYRLYYQVNEPLRFHTTVGNLIDEVEYYRHWREKEITPAEDGLKILLVGELAYNPERVLALSELGHQLYGLWMPDPYWYNYVGPLAFGHVQDLPFENWQEAVEQVQPDIIYALLNWQAVPFAHHVLRSNPGIPFVWHYKEGPFISLEKGHWAELVDLYRYSDGQIYTSPEMRDWTETSIPGSVSRGFPYILDGDLPKKEWFAGQPSPRISKSSAGFHTVVPGRPIGLHPHNVAELAANDIHLHFYGDFTHGQWREWIEKCNRLASGYIHLHSNVDQRRWLEEFSQYDAGWLHYFKSENQGEIQRSNWDDLNYPARIATLAAAGLPMLQRDNPGSIVATQNLVRELGIGLFFRSMEDLAEQLADQKQMEEIRAVLWQKREIFTFDYHAPALVDYFRQVIKHTQTRKRLNGSPEQSLSGAGSAPLQSKQAVKPEIALNGAQTDLVCFAHLRWDYVFQRPQHLLTRAAQNRRVFYVEEPRVEKGPARLETRRDPSGVRVVIPYLPDGLSKEETRQIHIELIKRLFSQHCIENYFAWYYTPMAVDYTRYLQPELVIYDCMDELSAFNGAPKKIIDLEAELLDNADVVFTGGYSLYEAKREKHPEVHPFPSSIEQDHFAQARTNEKEPADQALIPQPRLGFFGVIDERMDLELVKYIAKKRPDWQIVLVGPVAKLEEDKLPKAPNIHYLGQKTYQELPAYLAGWQVALMPFALNRSTRFISPTKTPEYLAGGKPVVSTPVRDVVRPYGELGLIQIAENPEQFVQAIENALSRGEDNAWLEQVDSFLSQGSWDETWERMQALILEKAGGRTSEKMNLTEKTT